jgi:3-dehydroquinate dehydratase-1
VNRFAARVLASSSPAVALSVTDRDDPEWCARSLELGVDVIELRLDRFAAPSSSSVATVLERFPQLPTLATVRSAAEGGDWSGSDDERLELVVDVLPLVDAVDVELSSSPLLAPLVAAAHDRGRSVVVSHHDFGATPATAQLCELLRNARDAGADLVKISTTARDRDDLRRLAGLLLEHADVPLCVIAMGEAGRGSRVVLPYLGSRLTYVPGQHSSAPGQLGHAETIELLHRLGVR